MTRDERAQLIEDIERVNNKRRDIIEMARASEDFDILAAWETLDELETSIAQRMIAARVETEQ